MRKILIVLLASGAAFLSGCTSMPPVPSSPAAIAEQTLLDEQSLIAAEASYKAAREILEAAVDQDLLTPGVAARFRALNAQTNAVLVRARQAYDAANAPSYAAAIAEAGPLINRLWQQVAEKGKSNAPRP